MSQGLYILENEQVRFAIDNKAQLHELINKQTGHNYAGGRDLWRIYYQHGVTLENEILAADCTPSISWPGDTICFSYDTLHGPHGELRFTFSFTVQLKNDEVCFEAKLANHQADTVLLEVHFPLVGNGAWKKGQQLIWSQNGGERFSDPTAQIASQEKLYMGPDFKLQQMGTAYPGSGAATNCYLLADDEEGLYLGSHDPTFQNTLHNLRLYNENYGGGLEAGMVKYPCLREGESTRIEGYVLAPYSGTWHRASEKYRAWADTWFKPAVPPPWMQSLKAWHRLIMKHQYGEDYFRYDDLPQILEDGIDVGIDTLFMFAWHEGGHDNRYPEYVADSAQGGFPNLKKNIEAFQANGGKVLLYSNGRLIDTKTDFYKTVGQKISIKTYWGSEVKDSYRFTGSGTFSRDVGAVSFVVACPSQEEWFEELRKIADTALNMGCKSVFYDQMGNAEYSCCDASHGHRTPHTTIGVDKAKLLQRLRAYIHERDLDMALGIELLSDICAQHSDYIHSQWGAAAALNKDWRQKGEKPRQRGFIEWFRYTFPEVIMSDREIRDDTDIERRVNHCLLKGLRSDVEIYRCRKTIREAPHYREYLKRANELRDQFMSLIVEGIYRDTQGFTIDNEEIDARCFIRDDKLAVLLTQSHLEEATTTMHVPGYRFCEHGGTLEYSLQENGDAQSIRMKRHALVCVVYERTTLDASTEGNYP